MNQPQPAPSIPTSGTPPISGTGGGASAPTEADVLRAKEGAKINIISPGVLPTGAPGSGAPNNGNQVGLGSLFEGKMTIEIIDSLLPALLVLAFHRGGMVVKKTDMQLTAKEKDTLTPVLQKCLDSILLNFDSPWTALAVTAGAIYGAKLIEYGGKAYTDKETTKAAVKAAQGAKAGTTSQPLPKHPDTQTGPKQPAANLRVVPRDDNPPGWPSAAESPDGPNNIVSDSGLPPWGEIELAKVKQRRKKGTEDAVQWLNENWDKKGGVI